MVRRELSTVTPRLTGWRRGRRVTDAVLRLVGSSRTRRSTSFREEALLLKRVVVVSGSPVGEGVNICKPKRPATTTAIETSTNFSAEEVLVEGVGAAGAGRTG